MEADKVITVETNLLQPIGVGPRKIEEKSIHYLQIEINGL